MEYNKPNPLKMMGILSENLRLLKQVLQIYFDATETHLKQQKTQVAILLNLLETNGL